MKEFDTTPNINNVIDALVQNEIALSRLYETYAVQFPMHEAFCRQLVREEVQHAQWIRDLQRKIEQGRLVVQPDRFSAQVIQFIRDVVKDDVQQAEAENLSYERALEIAATIERSMIEKKYFEIFASEDSEMVELMERLGQETEQHAQRIEQELAAVRSSEGFVGFADDQTTE